MTGIAENEVDKANDKFENGAGLVSDAKRLQTNSHDFRISKLLFRRVWRLTRPFWLRKEHAGWWALLAVLIGLAPISSGVMFWYAHLGQDVTNAIIAKAQDEYSRLFFVMTMALTASWVVQTSMEYLGSRINIKWRQWLTEWMIERYLDNRTYYDIAVREDLDNPDQRIQEDMEPFIAIMAAIPLQLVGQTLALLTGGFIIASVSSSMVWYVTVYAALTTGVTLFIYKPLIKLNFDSTMAEADLRYGILHVRDNAEIIAFYQGEASERSQILIRLRAAVAARIAIIFYQMKVSGITQALNQAWNLTPFFLVTPLFFAGEIEYGAIAMSTMAAMQMRSAMGSLSQYIPRLTEMAPCAVRLAQILERFDALDETRAAEETQKITLHTSERVELSNVSLETPGGEQQLVRDLSLSIVPGQHLLIFGQTGTGKSSLLRAMAGLWRRGGGEIRIPPPSSCLFLPQKPYMILGDLRSQLIYPRRSSAVTDVEICAVLERVGLPDLLASHGGLGAIKDWGKVLSLGEQQRIAFARAIIAKPHYVFLDEATSAVDIATEYRLYAQLASTGATYVSVGHRPSIIDFHVNALMLSPRGAWRIMPVTHVQFASVEAV